VATAAEGAGGAAAVEQAAAEQAAALAEEEEEPLLRRLRTRRATTPEYLEGEALRWAKELRDDVPIAHLRRREVGGPSGAPEEPRDRPGGPSLEAVGGRSSPEREEAPSGGAVGGSAPPATQAGVQKPPVVEEVPSERGGEPLGDEASASRPWTREEGRDPASFFYGSELSHRHLHNPAVMPEVSSAPKMLRPDVLPRVSPACAALTVRDSSPLLTILFYHTGVLTLL